MPLPKHRDKNWTNGGLKQYSIALTSNSRDNNSKNNLDEKYLLGGEFCCCVKIAGALFEDEARKRVHGWYEGFW